MISVIVCSRSLPLFQTLSDNIAKTIGVDFEIIRINNANGKMGICAAYNAGAAKAIFPYLCFVHEDVLFHTQYWGRHILAHFKADETIGLIGVAGAVYKSRMCSAWGESETGWEEIKRMNIIQSYRNKKKKPFHFHINPANDQVSNVVNLDGVLLITKNDVVTKFKFDELLLTGFHAYDFDFSMQVLEAYKVVVVYDILIEHSSEGSGVCWLESLIIAHKKWKNKLPVFVGPQTFITENIYDDGWKRLRKNIVDRNRNGVSFLKLSWFYISLFYFLDNKPTFIFLIRDFLFGFIYILRVYFNKKIIINK